MDTGLIETLMTHSQLDEKFFKLEFQKLLKRHRATEESLSLEALREILAEELQCALLEIKKTISCETSK